MVTTSQLKQTFEDLKASITVAYAYERFEQKHESVHYFLYDEITKAHIEIINTIKALNAEPSYLLLEIDQWITILKREVELKIRSNNPIKKKLGIRLNDFIESLEELKIHIPVTAINSSVEVVKDKTKNRGKVNEYNKPLLKRSQVLLLMHFLRKNQLLINDLDDSTLSECFGILTGFSSDKLRQSYIDFKKRDIVYKNEELNELSDLLIKMSKDIASFK
ncbi:MAG: hypothetical protein EOO43_12380 [Flavobacterium sp.]|nr:MAG: hypothetical protein EOO43_12380 [Flavobacterium sp.]